VPNYRFEPRRSNRTERFGIRALFILGVLLTAGFGKARAAHEVLTVPLILGDYYAWAYTEIFEDGSNVFGYSTAGVDALGWGWLVFSPDYTGLFLVNAAGIAKTIYPVTELLGSSDPPSRNRAWITLGTHALTLLSLEALGRPELGCRPWAPGGMERA